MLIFCMFLHVIEEYCCDFNFIPSIWKILEKYLYNKRFENRVNLSHLSRRICAYTSMMTTSANSGLCHMQVLDIFEVCHSFFQYGQGLTFRYEYNKRILKLYQLVLQILKITNNINLYSLVF